MVFDLRRIFADQIVADVFNRADKCLFLIFERCFADTVDSGIGIYLDKHPIGAETIGHKGFYVRHFHAILSPFASKLDKNSQKPYTISKSYFFG